MRRSSFALAIVILSACATQPTAVSEIKNGSEPKVGVVSGVRVGEVIFKDYRYRELESPERTLIERPLIFPINWTAQGSVPAGTKFYRVSEKKYCTEEKFGSFWTGRSAACLLDEDQDGFFERITSQNPLVKAHQLASPVAYNTKLGDKISLDAGGYLRQLIFQGRTSDTLRVTYREFFNDTARPAFTQELTYPIKAGRASIVFRSLTIDVTKIDDNAITYTVIDGNLAQELF